MPSKIAGLKEASKNVGRMVAMDNRISDSSMSGPNGIRMAA